jgi:hypothetical protein
LNQLADDAALGAASRQSRSKDLLDSMTEDQLRFSYGVVLQIEAHRQLGRQLDGNLKTCRIAIQEDVEEVKRDLVESNEQN